MTTSDDQQSATASEETEKPSVDELQADIERGREELAKTVDALGAKLDVKSRTRDRITATRRQAGEKLGEARVRAAGYTASAKDAATDDQGKPTPVVIAGAAAAVVASVVAAVIVYRRRR